MEATVWAMMTWIGWTEIVKSAAFCFYTFSVVFFGQFSNEHEAF